MKDPGLDGRVAIVTGAGSRGPGIGNGRAASVLLARAGARVLLVDLVSEALDETQARIAEVGGECLSVTADVSKPDHSARAVEAAVAAWGRVDVLVNNVGIVGPQGTVVDVDLEAWETCLRINLTSMLLMSRFSIPHMRTVGGGSIINITSAGGLLAVAPQIAYSTTKGAIINFTRSMAASHGPEGIRVNAVAPGMVHTPVVESLGVSEEARERRRLMAPLRTEGTGWNIGEAVLFLASSKSEWITGVTLPVDAGLTCTIPVALGPERVSDA